MATSPIFGAFGPLRKSIGSVTYSTLATARDGKRKQVARQKPTSVRNPNTVAQIMQRMKLAPAQRFYDAFEKVVAKGIMSHSWEGVSYGNASRQEFMSRAMKNDAAIYVPKGYNKFAPGEYEVSAGSLPTFNWRNDLEDAEGTDLIFEKNGTITAVQLARFVSLGYQAGDEISVIGASYNPESGTYDPFAIRCIMQVGNLPESFGNDRLADLNVFANGVSYEGALAAFAVIVSRGSDSNAKRSNAQMLLTNQYKSLISPEALNAAIASYQEGVEYNTLGSDWFLNQSTTAGVNGRVTLLSVKAVKDNAETTLSGDWAVVEAVQNGQVGYYVLEKANTNNTIALGSVAGGNTIGPKTWPGDGGGNVTPEEVARGIVAAGLNSYGTMRITQAIAEQGGFSVEGGI